MDSDLTPLHWLHNIDIMSHCGFEENQENRKNSNNVTVVDQTDYRTTNKKPPLSYSSLITKAIKSTPDNKLTLSQIYSWIKENYLFYSTAEPSWQNSIRHNLSLNKCFVKIPRGKDEPGKGGFWSLDESLVGRSGSKRKKKKKTNKILATVTNGNICSLMSSQQQQQQQQHPHLLQNGHTHNHTQILSNSCLILSDSNDTGAGIGTGTGTGNEMDNDNATGVGVGSPSHTTILHNIDSSSSSNNSNNNHTIILTHHPDDDSNCVDICQEAFSTHEEIVESEIIESELILENVYWESVLDLDHLISIGEL